MQVISLLICGVLAQLPPAPHVPQAPQRGPADVPGGSAVAPAPSEPAAPIAEPEAPPFANPSAPPPAGIGAPAASRDTSPPAAGVPPSGQRNPPAATGAPPAQPAAPEAGEQSSPDGLVKIDPHTMKVTAAEVLAEALRPPETNKIAGRPLSLVDVLRSVPDRTAQLRATETYWKLSESLAEYNFSWDEYQQFERLKPAGAPDQKPTADDQLLLTRMAAAKARLQDAELALVSAQYELAGAIRLPAGQPLPLPADVPHVGPYRTVLDQLYAGRAVPPRAVLIDRTLPIRRSAIDARATAVQAAHDALEAAEESYYEGRAGLSLVLSLIDELARQRRALTADARIYNNEIAEYAMSAPTPAMDAASLASMLIKPTGAGQVPGQVAGAGAGATGSGVERAGFNQPIDNRPPGPLQAVPEGQIPLAPPPGMAPAAPAREPTIAPPRPRGPVDNRTPTTAPPRGAASAGQEGNAPGGGQNRVPAAGNGGGEAPPFRAQRPISEQDMLSAPASAPQHAAGVCLYPALHEMAPAAQARQLAQVLCWEPASASAESAPVVLEDFLAAVPSARRNEALSVYWQAVHQAARAQVLAQQLEQYAALGTTIAADSTEAAAGPVAMLLVRAAHAATEADVRRAQVDRLTAQWSLTLVAGRQLNGPWLWAETAPHAGGYRLQLDELPRDLLESTLVRQLVTLIPQLQRSLVDRAAAVIAADQERGHASLAPEGMLPTTVRALDAIQAQGTETMAFLARLTEYNIEIAAYANAVLPPATSGQSLARALVMKPGHEAGH